MYFLGPDASVGNQVPHTGFTELAPGQSTTIEPSKFFMQKDTVAVAGVVSAITYKDGRLWPAPLENPPDPVDDAPVGLASIGVIGKHHLTQIAVSCFNHGDKDVTGLWYYAKFLDADGKELGNINHGYNGSDDDPFLKVGKGAVLTLGKPLPEGTTQVTLACTNIWFADKSVWKARKFRE